MRATLLAATVAVVVAVAATVASAGTSPWAPYEAPPEACAHTAGVARILNAQVREMLCLVNWTRHRAGLPTLRWSTLLGREAGVKAGLIASCGDFSHYSCGTRWPAAATRRQYDRWGENLYYGVERVGGARAALLAWLESPEHRAVLFGRSWRDVGATVRAVPSLGGHTDVRVWVLEVAGRATG